MAEALKPVARAAVVYALFVVAGLSIVVRLPGYAYTLGILLHALAGVILLAAGSIWVARSAGERDIILPAFAASIGWSVGAVAFILMTPSLRTAELIVSAPLRSLSLGLIVPITQAVAPIPLFSLAGQQFGFGIPWALLIIYFAVFWSRRRTTFFSSDSQHRGQA